MINTKPRRGQGVVFSRPADAQPPRYRLRGFWEKLLARHIKPKRSNIIKATDGNKANAYAKAYAFSFMMEFSAAADPRIARRRKEKVALADCFAAGATEPANKKPTKTVPGAQAFGAEEGEERTNSTLMTIGPVLPAAAVAVLDPVTIETVPDVSPGAADTGAGLGRRTPAKRSSGESGYFRDARSDSPVKLTSRINRHPASGRGESVMLIPSFREFLSKKSSVPKTVSDTRDDNPDLQAGSRTSAAISGSVFDLSDAPGLPVRKDGSLTRTLRVSKEWNRSPALLRAGSTASAAISRTANYG